MKSSVGHLPLDAIDPFVFEKDDRIVGADCALQQPFGIGGEGRDDHPQAGTMQKERLKGMGVLGAELVAGAARHPDDQRHPDAAAEHVAGDSHMIHDLVHGNDGEIDRHQLGNRPQTGHRRAAGQADDPRLGYRRIDDPPLAEVRQKTAGNLE